MESGKVCRFRNCKEGVVSIDNHRWRRGLEDSHRVVKKSLPYRLGIPYEAQRRHGTVDNIPLFEGPTGFTRGAEVRIHNDDARVGLVDDIFATFNHPDIFWETTGDQGRIPVSDR